MRYALRLLYFPIKTVIIIVFTPILTLVYWLVAILVGIPLYFFRKLLLLIVRLLDSEISHMVDSMGHIICRDYEQWYRSPSHATAVIIKLKGSYHLDQVRQLFLRKLIHKSDVNHHKLEYPELQQYFTKRLGYLFFKWDRTFDITNHITLYSDKELLPDPEKEPVGQKKLMQIWETIMRKPFLEKRSPWDVHCIPNCEDPEESILILRLQHGLCDGIVVYKLLLTLTDNGLEDLEKEVIPFRKAPPFFNQLLHLRAFLFGPASVARKMASGVDAYNPLHLPLPKKVGKAHIVETTFDLETIKKISRVHLDISFHSVLIAALAGGIRNYLLGNGHKIPLAPIRVGLPIPKPGHTHKLRNEYLCALIDLPVEKKTPRERLFSCEKKLKELTSDAFVPFMLQTWAILGMCPAKMARFLTLKSAYTVMYSEIRGPRRLLTVTDGGKVLELRDLVFSFGLGPDDLYFAFNSLSYNGKIHIVVTLDYGVAKTREKAQSMLNFIEKELEALQYGDSTNL